MLNHHMQPAEALVKIILRGVTERDLDLMLLEEIVVSAEFRKQFLATIGFQEEVQLSEAARSINTLNGETDLELVLRKNEEVVCVLIENKLDALPQPRQAERYRERSALYLLSGKASRVVTVLVAPECYGRMEGDFDVRITYEVIRSWFGTGDRAGYKRHVLEEAIARAASGWTMVRDDAVTSFWTEYWKLASRVAPALNMPQPGEKPAKSSFVYFRPVGLPADLRLVHKVRHGFIDLQFKNGATRIDELRKRYYGRMPPGMVLARAAKSAVLRTSVERIELGEPFASCEARVSAALDAAMRAYRWYVELVHE